MNVGTSNVMAAKSPSRFNVAREKQDEPLRECVRSALGRYFEQMGGHRVQDLHHMVISEVEEPMLDTVMQHCGGNQTRAAQMLGISRSTLRKKLAQYGLS